MGDSLLVATIWLELCKTYSSSCHHHLGACIILSSNKIQNGDVLVPANPGPPGKWKLKWTEREFSVTVTANLNHTALWVRNHVMECWQVIITVAKQCGKHVQRQLVETVSASSLWWHVTAKPYNTVSRRCLHVTVTDAGSGSSISGSCGSRKLSWHTTTVDIVAVTSSLQQPRHRCKCIVHYVVRHQHCCTRNTYRLLRV